MRYIKLSKAFMDGPDKAWFDKYVIIAADLIIAIVPKRLRIGSYFEKDVDASEISFSTSIVVGGKTISSMVVLESCVEVESLLKGSRKRIKTL